MIRVRIPATTANLGAGFDCLGLALDLHNTVELELAEDFRVEVAGEGEASLPQDRSHLVLRSALRVAEIAGKPVQGLHLRQDNLIPLARGMGSSSAAIVGGLAAANALLVAGMSQADLLRVAAEIEGHPDNVAPALLGGLTVCCIEQGELLWQRFAAPRGLKAVVAIPDYEVSTEAARQVMPQQIQHADGVYNVTHATMTLASLLSGEFQLMRQAMRDRLHQPYRAYLVQGFEAATQAALNAGACGAALSGSGPTIIAFATERETAVAEAMLTALNGAGVRSRTMVLGLDDQGAQVACV